MKKEKKDLWVRMMDFNFNGKTATEIAYLLKENLRNVEMELYIGLRSGHIKCKETKSNMYWYRTEEGIEFTKEVKKRYKKETIINCTPHDITILDENNKIIKVIKPSGIVARLSETITEEGFCDDIRIISKKYTKEELPPEEFNTYYIVSGLVALHTQRDDLLIPNTVRNEEGQIIGCNSFARIKHTYMVATG